MKEVDYNSQEKNILLIYRELLESYHQNKTHIPGENIVEIEYEKFVNNKKATLRSIYQDLKLGDFSEVNALYDDYLSTIENYETNQYVLKRNEIDIVNNHWGLAFEHYGYKRESTEVGRDANGIGNGEKNG